ncbi:hypothetical protein COY90_02100 [Candidatus Roizmanbacteria bacterium CG_4_10_14_0_8_um_filter_39_9]|uniref:Uncharacterized protein n=1 Tax=Candidatus Roizmanbacteria bacterium CG_4_10_14_0_8_um_filter_39_9 TaxID=1974829 RepID=A0A2M7QD53_9BACT|nr:MAG: hypothetical protein COY90_02100 [Candidatus Roizmanbacteria bacterium CG_4_10_14_0_8_um_filter_39_9]
MKNAFFFILIIVLLFFIAPLLIAGYFGFVPVLSSIMGADKPKDLGIKVTTQNYKEGLKKLGMKVETKKTLPGSAMQKHTGSHMVDAVFTQEEITAMSKRRRPDFPFFNPQIKINPDNSFEVSTIFKIDAAITYLTRMGISQEKIDSAFSTMNLPKMNFPLYLKSTGSITNNEINTRIQSLQVGRFSVPHAMVAKYNSIFDTVLTEVMKQDMNSNIISLTINDGKVYVKGAYPDIEIFVK